MHTVARDPQQPQPPEAGWALCQVVTWGWMHSLWRPSTRSGEAETVCNSSKHFPWPSGSNGSYGHCHPWLIPVVMTEWAKVHPKQCREEQRHNQTAPPPPRIHGTQASSALSCCLPYPWGVTLFSDFHKMLKNFPSAIGSLPCFLKLLLIYSLKILFLPFLWLGWERGWKEGRSSDVLLFIVPAGSEDILTTGDLTWNRGLTVLSNVIKKTIHRSTKSSNIRNKS